MPEKIILAGGAESQCHAIEILKNQGYHVIVVDYDADCMGGRLADEFFCVSTADVEEITRIAKEKNVKAVIAVQSDLGLCTSAMVSERLGLNHIPMDKVELFTNKYKMRQFLKEHGFDIPYLQNAEACRRCGRLQNKMDFRL